MDGKIFTSDLYSKIMMFVSTQETILKRVKGYPVFSFREGEGVSVFTLALGVAVAVLTLNNSFFRPILFMYIYRFYFRFKFVGSSPYCVLPSILK